MTGVAAFEALNELISFLDEEIRIYKELIDEFGDKLGKLLRTGDGGSMKISSSHPEKNQGARVGWSRLGELLTHRGESSKAEAEMYFESTEQLKTRLARLEQVKGTVNKLSELEPEPRVTYLVYLREGIPERVLLRRKEEVEKFAFENEFLVQ